jgi:hypothetical protein
MEIASPVQPNYTPLELIRLYEINKRTPREKARLFVSVTAVLRLYALTSMPDTAASRGDLFGLPRTVEPSDYPSVAKEASGRNWQAHFLEELVNHGYAEQVQKEGQRLYKAANAKKLETLVVSITKLETSELKAMLWPSQYASQDDVPEETEETASEEPEQESSANLGVTEVIERVASNLGEVAQHLSSLYETTSESNNRSVALGQTLDAIAGRLETGLRKFEEVAGEEGRRVNAQLLELLTRHTEIDIRKKSLINQLEAESRKAEQVLSLIAETLKRGS